jgi:hypothetical protein
MRRLAAPAVAIAVALLAVVAVAAFAGARGPRATQETPTDCSPHEDTRFPVTVTVLAAPGGTPVAAEGWCMILYQITVPPHTRVDMPVDGPREHFHPDPAVMYVSSGSIVFSVEVGEVWVSCRRPGGCFAPGTATATAPAAPGEELLPPGVEVVLAAGDWAAQYDSTTHLYRNDGDEPAVILVTALWYPSQGGCGGGCRGAGA